jgi:hypothetical protein
MIRNHRWTIALIAVGGLALLVAHSIRYEWVEPAAVGAFCEAYTTHWRCLIRHTVLALLTDQRLGWLAVGLSLVSLVLRSRVVGWITWFLASTGFVLYNAELAAPALLLAGIALARSRHSAQYRGRGERYPAAGER